MEKLLIVEDDGDINRLLCRILKEGGYQTCSAYSGTEALLLLEREKPALILLDLMLPGLSGEEVIQRIRGERGSSIPILVLSAKGHVKNKVEAMTLGADDYLTKPFEPEEVLVRVLALLRRCRDGGLREEERSLTYKRLALDKEARSASVNGEELPLTPHEYDILSILMESPDRVFSRETLYEMVWKNGYYGEDNTVNVHVSNIRKKIAKTEGEESYIRTVWGIGFKMG